jgi:polysaccharide deacetylase 2 family uncharacterized protein YibQ
MKKFLYVLIFIFIAINFVLIYIDRDISGNIKDQDADSAEVEISDHEPAVDAFEAIDLAFIEKNLNKKLIYTKKTDSLWYKYIKVPDSCSLSRYNLFFQKILRENNITVEKAVEYELSKKMVYSFNVENSIPATVELRITQGLASDLNLSGSLCIIIYAMGNDWGKEWVKNLLALPLPLTISILPNNPPSWARDIINQESQKNSKETIICLPMEPDNGNIDKENPIKILKGINYLSMNIVFDKMHQVFPDAKGIINFKGSKVIADYATMDLFFKKMSDRNIIYIENKTGAESFSELLCEEYNIPFILPAGYFKDYDSLDENFEKIAAEVLNGNDALIVIDANEDNYNYIKDEIIERFSDLNFLPLSQFIKQKR